MSELKREVKFADLVSLQLAARKIINSRGLPEDPQDSQTGDQHKQKALAAYLAAKKSLLETSGVTAAMVQAIDASTPNLLDVQSLELTVGVSLLHSWTHG